MEAYASVYDQPEQIDEGITSVVNSPQDKTKGPGPTYKGSRIKMGPGEGGRFPKRKEPEKLPYKGPRVKGGPGARKPIKVGLPMKREDVDVFDIVKGYLMTEHDLTEEQAMKVMLELEDEQRNAILEAYVVTLADKRGNTKAYQNYKAGMKSKVDGKPMYVAAPHLKGV